MDTARRRAGHRILNPPTGGVGFSLRGIRVVDRQTRTPGLCSAGKPTDSPSPLPLGVASTAASIQMNPDSPTLIGSICRVFLCTYSSHEYIVSY